MSNYGAVTYDLLTALSLLSSVTGRRIGEIRSRHNLRYIHAPTPVAAAQFLDSCHATIFRPLLFNAADAPADKRIDHVVGIAVRTFLAAYRRVASQT